MSLFKNDNPQFDTTLPPLHLNVFVPIIKEFSHFLI